MDKIKFNKTRREHDLIKVLGIMALVLLVLVNITDATPFAYISNGLDDSMSVIDTATGNVTATISSGLYSPDGVAVNPNGKNVYITSSGYNEFYVLNTTTYSISRFSNGYPSDEVQEGNHGVAASPDGTKVYIVDSRTQSVHVIDTATNNIISNVTVGSNPRGVVVNPKGTKVYVTNLISNTVSVIDTATNKVTATVNVGQGPYGVAVSPDGTKVYVANCGNDSVLGNTVFVIDTATNKVIATVNVGQGPHGVSVTLDGKRYM